MRGFAVVRAAGAGVLMRGFAVVRAAGAGAPMRGSGVVRAAGPVGWFSFAVTGRDS